MKNVVKKIINRFGYDLLAIEKQINYGDFYSKHSAVNKNIVDVEKLGKMSLSIPGMITPESGRFLFSLCYMQETIGDVVEIGSWQGRSTTFLARAVKESENGNFYAIDHFEGNVGKEELYKVRGSLSNLKSSFRDNIARFKLDDTVRLFDMVNTEAAKKLGENTVRFLFIDGDHTKKGVEKDIELFFPRLVKGSIVVFDDYFKGFPGLIEAVDEMFSKYKFSKAFCYRNTLVVKI
jgi:predicted O-methyltransferase YrrM